jgi:hypothetical protein
VLLDDPILISTGAGPGVSPIEARAGDKTFRFSPFTDPLEKRATLAAFDSTLTRTLPDNAMRGSVRFAWKRPAGGTTFVVGELAQR